MCWLLFVNDEEHFTTFVGLHSSPSQKISKNEDEEVESSPTIDLDDLVVEVSTSEDETKSVEDL